MEKFISECVKYITVTQDLSDLKNISNDTARAIIENCNVHIEIPVKDNNLGKIMEKHKK